MSLQTRGKRKKSGAEYRRLKLARIDEQEKLSSFMEDFLKNSARVPHDDIGEPIASYSAPVNVTDLDLGSPTSEAGPSVLIIPNVDEELKASESEMPVIVDKADDEQFNPERSNGTPTYSTSVSDCSTAPLADPVCVNHQVSLMTRNSEGVINHTSKQSERDDCSTAITTVMLADPCSHYDQQVDAMIDKTTGVIDPARLINVTLSSQLKEYILKLGPCHPLESILVSHKSGHRYCSKTLFQHPDGTKRQWISYSMEKSAVFCIPCLLFTDPVLRGEHVRFNQGNAFTNGGFHSWKKQHSFVLKHEASSAHRNAVIAQAVFSKEQSIQHCLNEQSKAELERKKNEVAKNRTILARIVDAIIFLGQQGLPLRGHRESLVDDSVNTGNFIELLKLISHYDVPMLQHLKKIKDIQSRIESCGKPGHKGRGSHLSFLSNTTQNNLIQTISQLVTDVIVKAIEDSAAWALIADTTPDVAHHEQISICVRIVSTNGNISEHLLACRRAMSTTAEDLFGVIFQRCNLRMCRLRSL